MKRILTVILVLLMILSLAGCASKQEDARETDVISGVIVERSHMYYTTSIVVQNNNATGGFKGPGLSVMTVEQALKLGDDTAVVLEGQIEKSLGKENYVFKDATGSVTIEIDDDDWKGQTVTPQDTIIIKGEVEKDMFKTEIDVDVVELKK